MGKWNRARLILALWAVAVLGLAVYAVSAKRIRQDWIARKAVAALAADAETGTVEGSEYLWGFGWQGPMVDLIERGRHYPEMERVMLLLEARRVYDWIYLYPHYRNADLRAGLTRHCLEHFPDDPKVHWAVGRLKLVGGEYGAAADEFGRTLMLGFEPWDAHAPAEHFWGRYTTALLLAGRLDELEQLYSDRFHFDSFDREESYAHADLQCTLGQYDEALRTLRQTFRPGTDIPADDEGWQLMLRASYWSGDIGGYFVKAEDYVDRYGDQANKRTLARLALLDSDFSRAQALAGPRETEPEWWSQWLECWDYYRLLADAFAVTGLDSYIDELDSLRDGLNAEIERIDTEEGTSWETRQAVQNMFAELISIAGQKARALALRGHWDSAARALAEVDPELSYRKDATYETVSALVAISRGEPLEEHSLGDLASTGAVTSLLLSPQLKDAAEASGLTWDEARLELVRAIRPERSNYWRWSSHGELDW